MGKVETIEKERGLISLLKVSERSWGEQIIGFFIYLFMAFPLFLLSLQLSPFITNPFWYFHFSTHLTVFAWFNTLFPLSFATSLWILWRTYSLKVLKLELSLSLLTIVFHTSWVLCFFHAKHPLSAFIILLLLLSTLLIVSYIFWRKDKTAGILALPYLLWIFYITILNMFFCLGNS